MAVHRPPRILHLDEYDDEEYDDDWEPITYSGVQEDSQRRPKQEHHREQEENIEDPSTARSSSCPFPEKEESQLVQSTEKSKIYSLKQNESNEADQLQLMWGDDERAAISATPRSASL